MHSQNDKEINNDSTTIDVEDDGNRAYDANKGEDIYLLANPKKD